MDRSHPSQGRAQLAFEPWSVEGCLGAPGGIAQLRPTHPAPRAISGGQPVELGAHGSAVPRKRAEVGQTLHVGQRLCGTSRQRKSAVTANAGAFVDNGEVAVHGLHLQPLNGVTLVGTGAPRKLNWCERAAGQLSEPAEPITEVQAKRFHAAEHGCEDLFRVCFSGQAITLGVRQPGSHLDASYFAGYAPTVSGRALSTPCQRVVLSFGGRR